MFPLVSAHSRLPRNQRLMNSVGVAGTGTWPAYYEDSLPPTVEIGLVPQQVSLFGTGAKFPARYQKALFLLDWTYSTIYSVDLQPTVHPTWVNDRTFITGSPLPVTDAVHRQRWSLLLRRRWSWNAIKPVPCDVCGDESTSPVDAHDSAGQEARALRHQLEALHGRKRWRRRFSA